MGFLATSRVLTNGQRSLFWVSGGSCWLFQMNFGCTYRYRAKLDHSEMIASFVATLFCWLSGLFVVAELFALFFKTASLGLELKSYISVYLEVLLNKE
jgi:hypothetical protein